MSSDASRPDQLPDRERIALLSLNMVKGIGGKTFRAIQKHYDEAHQFIEAGPRAWKRINGIGGATARSLKEVLEDKRGQKEYERIQYSDTQVITLGEARYPPLLQQVHDRPIILYVKGSIEEKDHLAVSVVGTRACSYYGKKHAKKFSTLLAHRGFTIVSGLARGIDTVAHEGALDAGGRTLAVLGCGVNRIYPHENKDLADQITGSGAVISEFPLDTPPEGPHFPQRNRIISGLSAGVFVIEAPSESGALITTDLALRQNRDIFALPGNVDSRSSEGCIRLIQEGARAVFDVDDIIEELDAYREGARSAEMQSREETGNITLKNEGEKEIFDLLSSDPLHVDQISGELTRETVDVSRLLTGLEMRGLVRQLPGKRFVRDVDSSLD